MALPGDQIPPDQNWLVGKIHDLEQAVEQLRAARTAEATAIRRAGLKVVDGNGAERLFMGHTSAMENTDQPVFFLRDDTGRLRFALYDPKPTSDGYQPVVWIYDHKDHVAFTTDINGGVAEPWVPIGMFPTAWPSTFLDATGTMLTLPVSALSGGGVWEGWIGKVSHPRLQYGGVFGRVTGASGTPTYTLKVNGVAVDSFTQTAFASTVRPPIDISNLLTTSTIVVQLTVSATGTGTDRIACQLMQCYLRQT